MNWQDIIKDSRFQLAPPSKQRRIREDWYQRNIKSDPRYKKEEDAQIREDIFGTGARPSVRPAPQPDITQPKTTQPDTTDTTIATSNILQEAFGELEPRERQPSITEVAKYRWQRGLNVVKRGQLGWDVKTGKVPLEFALEESKRLESRIREEALEKGKRPQIFKEPQAKKKMGLPSFGKKKTKGTGELIKSKK